MVMECPISREVVDQKVARLTALLVLGGVVVFFATPFKWIAALLAVDFAVRAFVAPRRSPTGWVARTLARRLGFAPEPVDAAPKRFAAGLGFAFSGAALALWATGFGRAALLVAAILGVCAALEGVVGYCLGCQVYTLLRLVRPKPRRGSVPSPPDGGAVRAAAR
jgi:hypothetical protein